jgi:c-di-GMP-related signal transduction protein
VLTGAPKATISNSSCTTAQVIVHDAISADIQTISDGHSMFVNFTLDLLVHDSALSLDPDAYVIEILSEVPASPDIIDACK